MAQPTPARLAALALLGLPEQASAHDITRAYRRLAKATHPDLHAEPAPDDAPPASADDAGHRFAALTDAYRSLMSAAAPGAEPATPAPPAEPADRHGTPVRVRVTRRPPLSTTRPPIVAGPVHVTPLPPSPPSPPRESP
jgi:hypothetical protein